MYKLIWQPKAVRQLEKIRDRKAKVEIVDEVKELKHFPDCQHLKKLKNHSSDYRLRIGRFRVLFSVKDSVQIINIEEVKKRDDRTY